MCKIKSISVKKLFGYEGNDYQVDLFPTKLISFMYGFNGSGKTTALRLIYAALKKQLTILDSISFEFIKIAFDTDEILTVSKTINKKFDDVAIGELQKDESGKYYFPIVYRWESEKENLEGKFYINESITANFTKLLSEDYEKNANFKFFVDLNTKTQVFLSEFYKDKSGYVEEDLSSREIGNKLNQFSNLNILYANKDYNRFASEQLLRKKADNGNQDPNIFEKYEPLDTIAFELDYVKNMVEQRETEINTMADITMDEFVMGIRSGSDYDAEKKYVVFKIPDKTQKMREDLKSLASDKGLEEYINRYAELDTAKKEREKDFCLFEEIINHAPGLTGKDIHINRNSGELEIKMLNGSSLTVGNLSSGEKNLLLLYFYLIFSVADNSILLIDEPEVSMHPDWLIAFVENMERIFSGRDNQFIIATHSPSITYGHSELMAEFWQVNNDR